MLDDREIEMMNVRWNVFLLHVPIREEVQVNTPSRVHIALQN